MNEYTYPGADTLGVLGGLVLTILLTVAGGPVAGGNIGGIAVIAIVISFFVSGHAKGWLWTFGTRCLIGYIIGYVVGGFLLGIL